MLYRMRIKDRELFNKLKKKPKNNLKNRIY
jgi:hypothetical protein